MKRARIILKSEKSSTHKQLQSIMQFKENKIYNNDDYGNFCFFSHLIESCSKECILYNVYLYFYLFWGNFIILCSIIYLLSKFYKCVVINKH